MVLSLAAVISALILETLHVNIAAFFIMLQHFKERAHFCTQASETAGLYLLSQGSSNFLVRGTLFRFAKYNGTSLM